MTAAETHTKKQYQERTVAKAGRLLRRNQFLWVAGGRKWSTGSVLLQARRRTNSTTDRGQNDIRVGFTATKRLGNAVKRNRAKRRLRAAADQLLPELGMLGHDYVLIARDGALTQPFPVLLNDIKEALKRVHTPYRRSKSREAGKKK